MAVEIPSKFEFEHLLAHTFPGFFAAISVFMLIDIWSPKNLTLFVAKDLNTALLFIGFILLFGSILGIIIDGIHHSLIEDHIFDNMDGILKIKYTIKKQCFLDVGIDDVKNAITNSEKYFNNGDVLTRHFFIDDKVEAYNTIHDNLIKNIYCYSEFYSNTFLSLILFSLVSPHYLLETLGFSHASCCAVSISSYILAWACLYSGYVAYIRYTQGLYSAIYGIVRKPPPSSNTPSAPHLISLLLTHLISLLICCKSSIDETNGKDQKKHLLERLPHFTVLLFVAMLGGSTLLLYLGIVFEVPAEDQEIRLSLDPSKIVVNLTEGNTYTEIVSLRNIGSDLTDINIDKYPDKKCSWLILSDFESPILNKSESGFIRVELNAANMDVGVYRNFIKIEGRMDDKTKSSELLPVVLNVEPIKERRDVKLDFSYVT